MKKLMILISLFLVSSLCYGKLSDDYIIPKYIQATSYLGEKGFKTIANYHPYYVIDDDPNTAWVEGVQGDGINQEIQLSYFTISKNIPFSIKIRNGYQKSETLFQKNNRVKEIELEFLFGIQLNKTYKLCLDDKMDWQIFNFIEGSDLRGIKFRILSVYKGSTYDDTCISDLQIIPEKTLDIDTQRKNAMFYSDWFNERKKRDVFFKNLPKEYIYKEYSFSKYNKKVSFKEFKNIDSFKNIFPESDWANFASTKEVNNIIDRLSSNNNGKYYNIIFNSPLYYPPELLSNNLFDDLYKFTDLKKMDLELKKDNIRVNEDYYIEKVNNTITKIKHYKYINFEPGMYIDTYIYDEDGRLACIDSKVYDNELYKLIFLVWKDNTIDKIYELHAYELDNCCEVEINIYK